MLAFSHSHHGGGSVWKRQKKLGADYDEGKYKKSPWMGFCGK